MSNMQCANCKFIDTNFVCIIGENKVDESIQLLSLMGFHCPWYFEQEVNSCQRKQGK